MIAPACSHDQTRKFGKDRKGNPRVQCCLCMKTWTVVEKSPLGSMRVDLKTAEQILKLLCEGTSVRATARLTNTCKQTVMDLMILIGERCQRYMDANHRGIVVDEVQCDEAWQFIYCKEKTRVAKSYSQLTGDSYVFTAIERHSKLLITWHFGKRDQWNTDTFIGKLAKATACKFTISTDGFQPYLSAVVRYLGNRVEHGTVVKTYGKASVEDQRKYSPARIISIKKEQAWNLPPNERICTSHIERHNLTLRTFIRSMTRLSCGFSKKWENHEAMLALAIMHYNYCRVHGKLKTTPAVASGLTPHRWTIREKTSIH
jgi:transposase-like protein/IS1 family transposase